MRGIISGGGREKSPRGSQHPELPFPQGTHLRKAFQVPQELVFLRHFQHSPECPKFCFLPFSRWPKTQERISLENKTLVLLFPLIPRWIFSHHISPLVSPTRPQFSPPSPLGLLKSKILFIESQNLGLESQVWGWKDPQRSSHSKPLTELQTFAVGFFASQLPQNSFILKGGMGLGV